MKFRTIILASIVLAFVVSAVFSQGNDNKKVVGAKRKLGILNGMATSLPAPSYPQSAKDFCAKGKVAVEVLIDTDGKVITAKAISGDELLLETSVAAAKRAVFKNRVDGPPARIRGMLVYNFEGVKRCILAGVANDKSLVRTKPIPDHPFALTKPVKVIVRIIVNAAGKVVRALASKDIDPAIRAAAEDLALTTTFTSVHHMPGDVFVSASLQYTFKPGGKIEY